MDNELGNEVEGKRTELLGIIREHENVVNLLHEFVYHFYTVHENGRSPSWAEMNVRSGPRRTQIKMLSADDANSRGLFDD